jgi:hypothetical protein
MKKISVCFLSLLIVVLLYVPAGAWSHGNRYGGSTSHSWGSTSHTSAWGTSTSHTAGQGTSHTNVYGGSATHYTGGGWSKTGAYGGTAYGNAHWGGAYYHPPYHPAYYPVYHPPTTVNYYGAGCYNCGGWSTASAAAAGAAVGLVAGAAVASANTNAVAASSYNAGVAAGAASATSYVMGALYPTLPAGCITPTVRGTTYYLCGNTWFQPFYGANGVYYRVVPTP